MHDESYQDGIFRDTIAHIKNDTSNDFSSQKGGIATRCTPNIVPSTLYHIPRTTLTMKHRSTMQDEARCTVRKATLLQVSLFVIVSAFLSMVSYLHLHATARLQTGTEVSHVLEAGGIATVSPPVCTAVQLATILSQLPAEECEGFSHRTYTNFCSFSYATSCPNPTWLAEYWQQQNPSTLTTPTAVYVGCNKAMDAVNTLRMISGQKTFDKTTWRTELFAGSSRDGMQVHPGHCGQEFDEQYQIPSSLRNGSDDAKVYCIEAMPKTAKHLNGTAHRLGWQDRLIVSNVAISSTDGVAYFPSAKGGNEIGVENSGLADCKGASDMCSAIPQYTLDTFSLQEMGQSRTLIDFLSVDVEGYDWEVLKGGANFLNRVKYLEFEYNWRGLWKNQDLSSSIDYLKNTGFTCYWTGSKGHLWRITDCWHEHYKHKFWSNIACVNSNLAKDLAAVMEKTFHQTLSAGTSIRYSKGKVSQRQKQAAKR